MNENFFVVIEGQNGVGKSELAKALQIYFNERVAKNMAHLTYEPNNDAVAGAYIRAALTNKVEISRHALSLAFALNRLDHCHSIKMWLQTPHSVVISDRYLMSSLVYQALNRYQMQEIYHLNREAIKPDLTILLDAPAEVIRKRLTNRGGTPELFDNNFEFFRGRYLEAKSFLFMDGGEHVAMVSANQSPANVLEDTVAAIERLAPKWTHERRIK